MGVRDGARRVTCAMGCGQCRGPPRTTGVSERERHQVRVTLRAVRRAAEVKMVADKFISVLLYCCDVASSDRPTVKYSSY